MLRSSFLRFATLGFVNLVAFLVFSYSPECIEVMDYFRAILKAGEVSQRFRATLFAPPERPIRRLEGSRAPCLVFSCLLQSF